MRRVEADYREVLQRTNQSERLSEVETLMLFSSRDQYDRDRYAWDLRSEFGFDHHLVTRDDVRRMEPDIEGEVAFGVVMKDWFHFTNPLGMQERFATYFQSRQGRILTGEVTGFDAKLGSVQALVLADGRRHPVRNVVLAAGAWSGTLASHLGVKIPIAHLQGYHIQVHDPKVKIERSIYYAPGSFVLTPMETGLRIGGTIEIAGPDPKPDYRRADVLAQRARTILPELDLSKVDRWMGPRPFMPDTLPVIGRAPHHGNVVLAFGHGQIGMTLGATTGQLVAELVTHEKPSVDLAPFRPERFSSRS
jgi:D-amino-acid dehydrogenase